MIENGVTGFIVESEPEAVAAIWKVRQLDRRRIRATFEQRFTSCRMAQEYVETYVRLAQDAHPSAIGESKRMFSAEAGGAPVLGA